MPWAQSVKAFQKHFETGNGLSLGLADPLARAAISSIGSILVWSQSPESVPLPTFSIFKKQPTESIKLLGVLRQTPRRKNIPKKSNWF
jgi:hypothetical protein